MVEIYSPAEDSWLMQDCLKKYLKEKDKCIKILDIGAGSGILGEACIELGFKNVICADISREVISFLKKKKLNTIKSDLFFNINRKFDLIIFNPPYLPEDSREPVESRRNTTGGKKGYEIIIRFLNEAKNHLNKKGEILLLFSSLSHPNIILKEIKSLGFKAKKLDFKKLDFEEIFIYNIKPSTSLIPPSFLIRIMLSTNPSIFGSWLTRINWAIFN